MRCDLTDLRLFIAVVRGGSITAGAASSNLALAAASARLSGMEANIGAALLERRPRGVRPTPAGTALLRHAEDMLRRAERMREEMRGFAEGWRGCIRLPANTGAVLGLLPRALAGFLRDHPGLDVDLQELPSSEIVRLVAEGAVEFGIVSDAVDPGGLELQRLCEDRLLLVAPEGHDLAACQTVAFAEVASQPLVGLLDAPLHRHLAEHAERYGVRLAYRARLRSVPAVGRLVQAGIGVAVLPESVVPELASLRLAFAPVAEPWARRRLAFCIRQPDDLTPAARLLADHIRAVAAEPVRALADRPSPEAAPP